MKLILRTIGAPNGQIVWAVDEERSDIKLPDYDGSDAQEVELVVE